ncbi:MAG TPA: DinB family protein [Planctomycetota bacterium]|nr:DinB family protein [Planctomycetota bacterium]
MNKPQILHELKRTLDLVFPFFDADPAMLARSYAPGKWTARQILGHVVDTECVHHVRMRHILSEPDVAIVPFNQDTWARTLAYPQRNLRLMQKLWTATRESLMELVDLLPEPLFGRAGRHPERASYRAWDVASTAATHAMHHYGQLVAIRDGQPWAGRGNSEG